VPYYAFDPAEAGVITPPTPDPAAPILGNGITLAQARDEIRAQLAGRTDTPDSRIDFWLNRAYIDLTTSMQKFDELKASVSFTTVGDVPHYILPESVAIVLNVGRADPNAPEGGVPLEKTDLVWYRRQPILRHTREHRPSQYFRLNRFLVLYPTPTEETEIILDYRFEPQKLTEDDHCTVLRHQWQEAWLTLARKKILSGLSEHEAALLVGNEFVSHMRQRLDRESGEDENRIVSSSVPRNKRGLRRR
jgi:hypothetical protein